MRSSIYLQVLDKLVKALVQDWISALLIILKSIEKTIQTLEDMLRCCILDFSGNWDEHLPLVEFTYNNSYQANVSMAPYETLYRRPCPSPFCWAVGSSGH